MLIHWIWLATRPAVSGRMKAGLLQHFHDPEDVYFASKDAFNHLEELTPEARDALGDKNLKEAQKILEQCTRKDIHILTYRDAAYPARLKNISDPPLVLYYKGKLPDFDGLPLIGVVGTRQASAYGLGVAKRMGYQLAQCGGIVVSGMALGIDAAAMQGALTAGGTVVGVIGCGVDIVYPLPNRALFADTEHYGCILSEYPPGTPPNGWNFPKRNRIISGLSCGVLVVEAPEKSGALITARQAADQGRDVFAVPGNIDMDSFVGSNRLLRDGAILASTGWDVLSEYEHQYPGKLHRDGRPSHQAGYTDEVERIRIHEEKKPAKVAQKPKIPTIKRIKKEKEYKKVIDNGASSPYSDVINKPKPAMSQTEQTIVEALKEGERLVDDVIAETGLATGKVLSALTLLEIKGVIKRHPGKRISLK